LKKELEEANAMIRSLQVAQQSSHEDMTTVPTLGYWNIRGLGASIRYILTFLNVPFENKLYNQG
jgi:hypothetical protein